MLLGSLSVVALADFLLPLTAGYSSRLNGQLWMIGLVLVGLGAALHLRRPARAPGASASSLYSASNLNLLPFVSLAVLGIALLFAVAEQESVPLTFLVVAAVLIGIATVARHLAALNENAKLARQLQAALRLEGLGRLAGGIAHDVNNLLTVINNYAELLDEALEGRKAREDAREIVKTTKRGAGMIRSLLAFAKRQATEPHPVSVAAVAREMEGVLRGVLGKRATLDTRYEADAWLTLADESQLEQVILNLVVNAHDAMPDGGGVTVAVANYRGAVRGYAETNMAQGDYVKLSVIDTGVGMDEHTLAHMFEPFFTTKSAAQGSGLGLSTVYGIVNQASGHIVPTSVVGKGTRFDVYFPRLLHSSETSETDGRVEVPGRTRTA